MDHPENNDYPPYRPNDEQQVVVNAEDVNAEHSNNAPTLSNEPVNSYGEDYSEADIADFDGIESGAEELQDDNFSFDDRKSGKGLLFVVLLLALLAFGGFYFMTNSNNGQTISASLPVVTPQNTISQNLETDNTKIALAVGDNATGVVANIDEDIEPTQITEGVLVDGSQIVEAEIVGTSMQGDVETDIGIVMPAMTKEVATPIVGSNEDISDTDSDETTNINVAENVFGVGLDTDTETPVSASEEEGIAIVDVLTALVDLPDEPLLPLPEKNVMAPAISADSQISGVKKAISIQKREPVYNQASETFFDAEQGESFNSTLKSKSQNEIIDPRREYFAQFIQVQQPASNVITTDNHSDDLARAQRALALNRPDAALEFYNRLYAKNRRDVRILMGRATTLQKLGRNAEAINAYEEVLDVDQNNTSAFINLTSLMQVQNPEVALQRLGTLYQRYPDNADVSAQLGLTYAGLGRYKEAVQYMNKATAIDPNNALHIFNTAIIYDRAGQQPQAIALYEKALEVEAIYGGNVSRESIYDRLATLR